MDRTRALTVAAMIAAAIAVLMILIFVVDDNSSFNEDCRDLGGKPAQIGNTRVCDMGGFMIQE
jgi:hypothetical protein